MRLLVLTVVSSLLVGCHKAVEVRGLYVQDDGTGTLFVCDHPDRIIVRVSDSALARHYRRNAARPSELLFVRVLGVAVDSGSIYSGSHHLLVRQVLEVRRRREGECPGVATPLAPAMASQTGVPN